MPPFSPSEGLWAGFIYFSMDLEHQGYMCAVCHQVFTDLTAFQEDIQSHDVESSKISLPVKPHWLHGIDDGSHDNTWLEIDIPVTDFTDHIQRQMVKTEVSSVLSKIKNEAFDRQSLDYSVERLEESDTAVDGGDSSLQIDDPDDEDDEALDDPDEHPEDEEDNQQDSNDKQSNLTEPVSTKKRRGRPPKQQQSTNDGFIAGPRSSGRNTRKRTSASGIYSSDELGTGWTVKESLSDEESGGEDVKDLYVSVMLTDMKDDEKTPADDDNKCTNMDVDQQSSSGSISKKLSQYRRQQPYSGPPSEKRHKCPHPSCAYASNSLPNVRRHAVVHVPAGEREKFPCTHCRRLYADKHQLKQHTQAVHTGEVSFACEFCHHRFSSRQGLSSHRQLKHSEGTRYKCSICGRFFATSVTLDGHMNRHMGDAAHKCSTCDRQFFYETSKIQHQRTCQGAIPNSQRVCEYICTQCGNDYNSSSALRDHITAQHTDSPQYNCRCGKSFIWRQSFSRHKQKCCSGKSDADPELNTDAELISDTELNVDAELNTNAEVND